MALSDPAEEVNSAGTALKGVLVFGLGFSPGKICCK